MHREPSGCFFFKRLSGFRQGLLCHDHRGSGAEICQTVSVKGQECLLEQIDLRNYNARYFDSYDDSWLDFVALCRAGKDKSDYDIVTGGIANDKVFRTIDLFFSGEITKDDAMRNLFYETPNVQICLRSQELLDAELTYISSEEIR